VLSGIIASTCLAVLFVPSFFTVLQGFEEWRKARKKAPVAGAPTSRIAGLLRGPVRFPLEVGVSS
jgi:HAE1 family hydrophobic/amphiphilic exporter-1